MADRQIDRDANVQPRRDSVASAPTAIARAKRPAEAANTPEQYELLLAKLAHAEHELGAGTTVGRSAYLEAASTIVFDLLYSLDFRQGGELIPRLAAIYGYIGNELLTISRTGDTEQLDHLRDIITTLRESWRSGTEGC
jgi:flagellar protein FliS